MPMLDDKMKKDTISSAAQTMDIEISDKQIEIFARRLLPEIMKLFSNGDVQREFDKWLKNRNQ